MVVRMWHGVVPNSKALAYRAFLNERAVPDYRAIKGNLSAYVLERKGEEHTHFVTLTFWESMEAVRRFAGPNPGLAKYYPEDKDYLVDLEPNVVHYEVTSEP